MKLSFPLLSFLIIHASSDDLRRGNLLNFKGQMRNVINANFIKTLDMGKDGDKIQDNLMMEMNVDLSLERPRQVRPLIGTPLKNYECHAEDILGWPIVVLKEDYHCELCYSIAYRDAIQDLLADRLQMQLSAKGTVALRAEELFEFEERFMVEAKRFTDETLENIKPCPGIEKAIESIYKHLKITFRDIVKAAASKI